MNAVVIIDRSGRCKYVGAADGYIVFPEILFTFAAYSQPVRSASIKLNEERRTPVASAKRCTAIRDQNAAIAAVFASSSFAGVVF